MPRAVSFEDYLASRHASPADPGANDRGCRVWHYKIIWFDRRPLLLAVLVNGKRYLR